MRTTIRDVAMVAGCSITAVSLVLNGKTRNISAQTEARILDAAKQLNYHPNKLASHLVTKKSNIIGLILPDNCNLFFGMVLKAAIGSFAGIPTTASTRIARISTRLSIIVWTGY